ncbi:hypothetical protein VTI74DRAFT_346 [Chaetomium olivicolor]
MPEKQQQQADFQERQKFKITSPMHSAATDNAQEAKLQECRWQSKNTLVSRGGWCPGLTRHGCDSSILGAFPQLGFPPRLPGLQVTLQGDLQCQLMPSHHMVPRDRRSASQTLEVKWRLAHSVKFGERMVNRIVTSPEAKAKFQGHEPTTSPL